MAPNVLLTTELMELREALYREREERRRERSRDACFVTLAKQLVGDALSTLDASNHQPPGVAAAYRRLRDLERILAVTTVGSE